MVVRSAMVRDRVVTPLEIELVLAPGLPTIEFLGRPEVTLKESAARIKTALRSSGHSFPKGRKVLVDLRPRLEKKHGLGLDLPIAIGILAALGEVPLQIVRDHILYGDLTLSGDVLAPEDVFSVVRELKSNILTGPISAGLAGWGAESRVVTIENLRDPIEPRFHKGSEGDSESRRGLDEVQDTDLAFDSIRLDDGTARIAAAVALGRHSILMAGPAGTGKTTLAKVIHEIRPRPTEGERREIAEWGAPCAIRPFVSEHHSAREIAMVGGGSPPRPGAVTRAHGGTLVLDEALLFRPQVQDALREPTESGFVNIARGSVSRRFPSRYLLIGTTNLCACGQFTEERPELCVCSRATRRQYAARRRGPFIDRFHVLAFSTDWRPGRASLQFGDVRAMVERGERFRSCRLSELGVQSEDKPQGVFLETISERRRLAVQGLARTFADLDGQAVISERHFDEAKGAALDRFLIWSGGNA